MSPTPPPSEQIKPATKRTIDYTKSAPKSAAGGRLADVLKTLVWVVPLTVLIWFYAEREQSTEVPNVTIPIAVRINAPNKLVRLTDPADGKIVATLAGPRNAVSLLIGQFNKPDHPLVITRTLDASTQRGPIQIPASALGDDSNFVNAGVTVRAVAPQALVMDVDDLVTEEAVPVRAPSNASNLVGNMLFTPSTVKVTAPRQVLEQAMRASPDGKLFVTADTSKLDTLKSPGSHENQRVNVDLQKLTNPNLKIDPPSVSANFVVAANDGHLELKNVPIWPTGPEGFLHNNDIEIQGSKSLASLTIYGPLDAIKTFSEKYKKGLHPPFVALVYLDSADRGDVANKPLTFCLSDGLHVDPASVPTVSLRVTPKP